jgi:hypothetical protein
VFVETETPTAVFFSHGDSRGGLGEMTIFQQRFKRWNFFFVNSMWYKMAYIFGAGSWDGGRSEQRCSYFKRYVSDDANWMLQLFTNIADLRDTSLAFHAFYTPYLVLRSAIVLWYSSWRYCRYVSWQCHHLQ